MDYTLSPGYWTHPATGQRMHREDQAVPTAVADLDMNSLIWSLMELTKAAGFAGVQFDPGNVATYDVVKRAVQKLISDAVAKVEGQLPAISERTLSPGDLVLHTGAGTRTGTVAASGGLVLRSDFPKLYEFAAAQGLVSEAVWSAGAWGRYSVGNGSTNFRLPDWRGMALRGFDNGRGIDSGRQFGVVEWSQNLAHTHTGTTDWQSDHQHDSANGEDSSIATGPFGNVSGVSNRAGFRDLDYTNNAWLTGPAGGHSHSFVTASSGGSEARMTNLPLVICIKY